MDERSKQVSESETIEGGEDEGRDEYVEKNNPNFRHIFEIRGYIKVRRYPGKVRVSD